MRCATAAFGLQEGAGDFGGGEPADHAQRQRDARVGREHRMAGREDQAQHLVAEILVAAAIEIVIRHGVLLGVERSRDRAMLAGQHRRAAQVIERAVLGGGHQPGARTVGHAGLRPPLQCGDEGVLRQFLGERHVAQHPGERRDQPRLLDPPRRQDRAMDALGHAGRGPAPPLVIDPAMARTSQVPSQPGMWSLCTCMNSRAQASASSAP